MFSYRYWPFDWGAEVAAQLRRVQHQAQIITSVRDFEKMEHDLIRLVNKGVYLEIVICQFPSERTMKHTNILRRLAVSGSNVFTTPLFDQLQRTEYYAIFDRQQLLSNTEYEGADNHGELLLAKSKELERIASHAEKLNPSADEIRIVFQADQAEVSKGRSVQLYWDVEEADFIELDPGFGPVASSGTISASIYEDTLFRLKAGNRSGILIKSLFVKMKEDSPLSLQLSVFDTASSEFIPLQSANSPDHIYAVLKSDRLRLEWSASASGLLSEARLGSIQSNGEHVFQVFHDEKFTFTFITTYGEYVANMEVYTHIETFSAGIVIPEQNHKDVTEMPERTAPRKGSLWQRFLRAIQKIFK